MCWKKRIKFKENDLPASIKSIASFNKLLFKNQCNK